MVTDPVNVKVHVSVPEQDAPDHPLNAEPFAGSAFKLITVPDENKAEQVTPQSMSLGPEVTKPWPDPSLVTLSDNESPEGFEFSVGLFKKYKPATSAPLNARLYILISSSFPSRNPALGMT